MSTGSWLMLAVLLFVLFASPLCAAIHIVLALLSRNGPDSRVILLGLLPSIANLIALAHPGYTRVWFPGLRRYWPPEPTWFWFTEVLSYSWTTLPSFAAVAYFSAEVLRPDRFTDGMIRAGVCIAYFGVMGITYSLLFGNWE